MDYRESKWDKSYSRGENHIFYPIEEIVKFLNRNIRKKTGCNSFNDLIDFSSEVRALDFGCGIGRNTILLQEFGVTSFGVDISTNAIQKAKELACSMGKDGMNDRFIKIDSANLPFEDCFFDFTISNAALDSMNFDIACECFREIERVTKQFVFLSLISGDNSEFAKGYAGEKVLKSVHEKDTIQSYFNMEKINKLTASSSFIIKDCRLIKEENVLDESFHSRYYIVLQKNKRSC